VAPKWKGWRESSPLYSQKASLMKLIIQILFHSRFSIVIASKALYEALNFERVSLD
jgi:hypothetical protein